MKPEKLKQANVKQKIITSVIILAMIAALILNYTRANYKTAESIPLINGTVNYDASDLNAVAVYIQDEAASDGYAKSDTIPTSGYTFNEEMSYCTIDGARDDSITLSYKPDTQSLSVSPMTTSGTKCYLYFDEQQALLADVIKGYNQSTRSSFSSTYTTTTTKQVFTAQDDDGTTYYFAGNPTDNWVSFAGFYWRIIRVNGDGSIRLIYAGVADSATPDSSNTTGTGTQIGTSTFSINSSTYNNNAYVGYMYTLNEVHGTGTESGIKKVVDSWYKTNIVDKEHSSYVDTNAGFCNDRTPSSGSGTSTTYYGAYNRLNDNKSPSFKCSDKNNDLFTASGSNKGNKKLTYPVGLITADEVAYAGGIAYKNNQSYYLYTGQNYWTMSPSYFYSTGLAWVFLVYSSGYLDTTDTVNGANGVRPVLNLKADTAISGGNGSSDTPFVVAG